MKEFYQGQVFKVLLSDRAESDFVSMGHDLQKCPKKLRDLANLKVTIERYADVGRISNPEKLNYEDDGFYSFKSYQTRAYFWKSKKLKSTVIISHFAEKKKNKLSKADKKLMHRMRDEIET